jgi:acyl carrier protein
MMSAPELSLAECKHLILKHLKEIAPEEDVAALRPHDDICEMLEIDQVDFHSFLLVLSHDLGIEIPDQDAGHLNTIDKLAKYMIARVK